MYSVEVAFGLTGAQPQEASLEGVYAGGDPDFGDFENTSFAIAPGVEQPPHDDQATLVLSAINMILKKSEERPLLNANQELRLARRVQQGDSEAKRIMIESNLRLVTWIAQTYQGRGLPLEDLLQEGTIGLIVAVEKFDPKKGTKLSTYATIKIWSAVDRAISKYRKGGGRSYADIKDYANIMAAETGLAQKLGRSPTLQEIATATDLAAEEIGAVLTYSQSPVSTVVGTGDDSCNRNSFDDSIIDDSAGDMIEAVEVRMCADGVLERFVSLVYSRLLTHEQRQVMILRHGLEDGIRRTLHEVAPLVGKSHAWVATHENRALERILPQMRDQLAELHG